MLLASRAVITTSVVPKLKDEPLATVETMVEVGEQLSVAVIVAQEYVAEFWSVKIVVLLGQLFTTGGTPSKTVIGMLQVNESFVRVNKRKGTENVCPTFEHG